MDWKLNVPCVLVIIVFLCKGASSLTTNTTLEATGESYTLQAIHEFTDYGSENPTCLYDFGDEETEVQELTATPTGVTVTRVYTSYGDFDIYIECLIENDFSRENWTEFYVGDKITNLVIEIDGKSDPIIGLAYPITGSSVSLTVSMDTGTNVTLNVTLLHTGNSAIYNDLLNGSNVIEYPASEFTATGLYTVEVTAWNPITPTIKRHTTLAFHRNVSIDTLTAPGYTTHVKIGHEFDVQIKLTSGSEVTFTMTVTHANSTVMDIISYQCDGEVLVHSFNYTIPDAVQYTFEVEASNYLNSQKQTLTLTAVNIIQGFTVTHQDPISLVSNDVVFNIAVDSGALFPMGTVTCVVHYGDGSSRNVTFDFTLPTTPAANLLTDSTAKLKYTPAGTYHSRVTCTNPLPSVLPGTTDKTYMEFNQTIISEHPVENIILDHDSPNSTNHKWSGAIKLDIELATPASDPPLANLTCVFNFDDTNSADNIKTLTGDLTSSSDITYTKLSFSSGNRNFSVSVNCSNHLTSKVLTQVFYIYYDCWKLSTYFDPEFNSASKPRSSKTNEKYTVPGTIQFTGICTLPIVMFWNITRPDNSEYYFPWTTSTYAFQANTMMNGLNKVCLSSMFTYYEPVAPVLTDCTWINYDLPDLDAKITDGSIVNTQRRVLRGSQVIMDSSASNDPANQGISNIPESITRAWSCFTNAGLTTSEVQTYLASGVWPAGKVKTNCASTMLNPNGGTTAAKYVFPSDTFAVNTWFVFELVYSRGSRNVKRSQAIYATLAPPLTLNLSCISNCYDGTGNMKKLVGEDLQLEASILTEGLDSSQATYLWTFEYFDTSLPTHAFVDKSHLLASRTDSGVQVTKAAIASIVVAEGVTVTFQVTCMVTYSGYADTPIVVQYVRNLPPYKGTCVLTEQQTPILASITEVCVSCSGWVDEGSREERDAGLDSGASLKYIVLQKFLNATGGVNESRPAMVIRTSTDLKQCFNLGMPDKNINNDTRIEVQIADTYLNPPAVVSFTRTVQSPIPTKLSGTSGADQVEGLVNKSDASIQQALSTNDISTLTTIATSLFTCLHVETRTIEIVVDTEVSFDKLSGAGVDASDALKDNVQPVLDESTKAVQKVNLKLVTDLTAMVFSQKDEQKTDPEINSKVLIAIYSMTAQPEENYDKDSLGMATDVMKNMVTVFSDMDFSNPNTLEFITDYLSTCQSVDDGIKPMSLNDEQPDVTSIDDARKIGDDILKMGDPKVLEAYENSDMTPDLRAFMLEKQQQRINLVKNERLKLANTQADTNEEMAEKTVDQIPLSEGSSTKFGKGENTIVLTKESSSTFRTKPIHSETTDCTFTDGVTDDPQESVTVGIMEAKTVLRLDAKSRSSQITSSQKTLIIKSESRVRGRVKIVQKVTVATYTRVTPVVSSEDASRFSYHKMYVRSPDDMMCVSLKPTATTVSFYKIWIAYEGDVSKVNFVAVEEATETSNYTVCFGPGQRPGRQRGVWKYGVETILKSTGTSAARKRRAAVDPSAIPAYELAPATMACTVWDGDASAWASDRCDGTWQPTEGTLTCDCISQKKLTFANTFYVPPNTIDFSSVFLKFSPLNQAAVMATLAVILVLYILITLWARRQDKKDLLRWGITPLADNFPEDNYFYVVRVYTGIRPGSGTRSKIGVVIAGDEMDTGVRELYDGVRKEFSTGSVLNFLLSTNTFLGDLEYIRLWHDNSGDGGYASWYLSKIEVQDVQRQETFVFMAGRWLSVEEEESSLECVVPVCKTENINVFQHRFFSNAKENLADSHIWISVVFRPQTSNFTRVQRTACAFVFIMLTMIANAVYYKDTDTDNYATAADVQVGPFRFSLQQVYTSFICAAITTPATLVVIYMFKMARPKPPDDQTLFQPRTSKRAGRYKIPFVQSWLEKEQQRSVELEKHVVQKGFPVIEGRLLPYWMMYVAWFVAFAAVFLSGFFVMLYSMEWGKQKSEEWLTMFFMSFFESVICLDPIKVGMMALVFALIFRSTKESNTLIDRRTVMKKYAGSIRGQTGGIRLPAPPLDAEKLEAARTVRQRELLMRTAIRDTFICGFLIWILFSISYSNRDINSYNMHKETVDLLLESKADSTKTKFSSIRTTEQFFHWLNYTAIYNLFPEYALNGERYHWRIRQYVQDEAKFRVGPPRLRQLRTTKEKCDIPYVGNVDCFRKYYEPTEDDKDYCIGWHSGPCNPAEAVYKYSADAWKFTSAFDIWGFPISGYYTTYSGGGYISKLSVNREVSRLILDELHSNSWVDRQSRAVILEFTLYCPNVNLFTYNMFMVEFPETGGAFPYFMILPVKLYQHIGTTGAYTLACELIFMLYLLVMTIIMFVQIYQQRRAFTKKPWQVFDAIFIVIGYVAIVMYIVRYIFTRKSLSIFVEDKKQFINFYHIALWDQVLTAIIGILVSMATLRLLNVLGYNKRILAVVRVFSNAANQLIWFGIFFLNVFTCYAVFGYLLFGSKLKSYKNVYSTMGTLFISMIGKSRFTEIEETDPIFSKIYFMIFIFFVVYMILTMFLAVLSKSIDQVHMEIKQDKGEEMVEYLLKKFKSLLSINRKTNRNTSGEYEFKSLLSINRKTNRNTSVEPAPPPAPWHVGHKRNLYDITNRQILEDIRLSLNDALEVDKSDFRTPLNEKSAARVKFRR